MSAEKNGGNDTSGTSDMNAAFARVEDTGGNLAIGAMIVAGLLYLFGVLDPIVPLRDLPGKIGAGVDTFVTGNDIPHGWALVTRLGEGDMLALASMMLVILVVVVAYLMLIPGMVRRKDYLYLTLVLLQVVVFIVAGGGWLGGAH